jgi:hypothetical protein
VVQIEVAHELVSRHTVVVAHDRCVCVARGIVDERSDVGVVVLEVDHSVVFHVYGLMTYAYIDKGLGVVWLFTPPLRTRWLVEAVV